MEDQKSSTAKRFKVSPATQAGILAYLHAKAKNGVVSGISQEKIGQAVSRSQTHVQAALQNLADDGLLQFRYERRGAEYVLLPIAPRSQQSGK